MNDHTKTQLCKNNSLYNTGLAISWRKGRLWLSFSNFVRLHENHKSVLSQLNTGCNSNLSFHWPIYTVVSLNLVWMSCLIACFLTACKQGVSTWLFFDYFSYFNCPAESSVLICYSWWCSLLHLYKVNVAVKRHKCVLLKNRTSVTTGHCPLSTLTTWVTSTPHIFPQTALSMRHCVILHFVHIQQMLQKAPKMRDNVS